MQEPSKFQEPPKDVATAHPEVEFALVLARTIEAVRNDPEQLRGAIYELARQKLQEQFTPDQETENARLLSALEVAIHGVEAHSRKVDEQQLFALPHQPGTAPSRHIIGALDNRQRTLVPSDQFLRPEPERPAVAPVRPRPTKKPVFGAPLRYLVVLVLVGLAGVAVLRRADIISAGRAVVSSLSAVRTPVASSNPQPAAPVVTPAPVVREPPAPPPGIPTTYGIYAVHDDKLYELEPLIGRVPDARVAISAAITKPSTTIVPEGRLKFIVYRRDSANSAPDQVEVRLIAKVVQAMTFDAAGKPTTAPAEESWVIRNISLPYRTAPMKDNAEMYEIAAKDPNAELTPGRYGLVMKGQAFDFTIAGPVTDKRQCLERIAAANGTFYSECPKP